MQITWAFVLSAHVVVKLKGATITDFKFLILHENPFIFDVFFCNNRKFFTKHLHSSQNQNQWQNWNFVSSYQALIVPITVTSEYATFIFLLQGVRVVLAANFPTEKLSSKEVRTKWVHNLTQEALARHADGVNIDIESPIAKRSREVTLLTKLVNETATAFRSAIKNSQVITK